MKHFLSIFCAGVLTLFATNAFAETEPASVAPVLAGDAEHAPVFETREQRDARMKWWRDAKFGMFIHFGLYSGLAGQWRGKNAGGEWIQNNVGADTETYCREAFPRFTPSADAAAEWAKLAKEAGCRYVVFTTKHHDGFALFDSAQTNFNSKKQFGRDFVREIVDAARANDLRVGFYHSVIDWAQPDYDYKLCEGLPYPTDRRAQRESPTGTKIDRAAYQKFLKNQARELLSNYGKIDVIWWDYSQGSASGKTGWDAPALIEMCRAIQPEIIMNNRLYAYSGLDKKFSASLDLRCGDFMTPEKHIPEKGYPDTDWEACMTVGNHWGYAVHDKNFKSVETVIRQLQECAAKGGNFLLNIGPRGDGSVPEAVANVLRGVGKWLRVNGEAIYDTRPFFGFDGVLATQSADGKFVYVFLPRDGAAALPSSVPDGVLLGEKNANALCPVLKISARDALSKNGATAEKISAKN